MRKYSLEDKKDIFFMRRVLELASQGWPKVLPNPLVGAVITKNDRVISEGFHKKLGSPHAEIEAINSAKQSLKGATLYVNLEPCTHWGRTPPCVERIIKEGIKRVVIGSVDPNPLVSGKGVKMLRSKKIEVKVGVLRKECLKLNKVYFTFHKLKRPFIVLKIAQSLDGKIATSKGTSKWITSPRARIYNKKMRSEYQGILVGINTVLKDNPHLSSLKPPYPCKIILDTYLRLHPNLNIFKSPGEVWVFTSKFNKNKIKKLPISRIFYVSSIKGLINLKEVLDILYKEGMSYILIEGGAKIFGSFVKEKAVDKIIVYISGKIIGSEGLDSIYLQQHIPLHKTPLVNIKNLTRIGKDVYLEGEVKFPE